MDESSKQHLKDVRKALPMEPGKPERFDAEYKRNGTCLSFSSLCVVGGVLILQQDGLLLIGHYKFASLLMRITLKPKKSDW